MTDRLILITKAPAGVSGTGTATWGGGSPNRTSTSFYCREFTDGGLESPLVKLEEGGWLLDKTAAPLDRVIDGVVSGPMLDITLPPGTIDRFGKKEKAAAARMLGVGGLQGGFATVTALAITEPETKQYGSLDSISLDLYLDYWRGLGAKVGRKIGGLVEWEGQIELL